MPWRLFACSGMIAGCDRCAAGGAGRGSSLCADLGAGGADRGAETMVADLEAMVADLRVQLAAAQRAESRNSGNSSMPPSSDDLPGPEAAEEAAARCGAGGEEETGEAAGQPGRGDAVGGSGPDRGPLPGGRLLVRP